MALEEERYRRITSDDDPERCHAVNVGMSKDQCKLKAIPGSKFCALHGGIGVETAAKKQALANYRLQQYSERVADFANSSEVKNLREEIGITRMVLETLLNNCKKTTELLAYSDKISNLVGQVSRLIETAQKLEEKNNNLLDRKVIIVIADSIVTIIGQYISDPDKVNEIGAKICESIAAAASPANQPGIVA